LGGLKRGVNAVTEIFPEKIREIGSKGSFSEKKILGKNLKIRKAGVKPFPEFSGNFSKNRTFYIVEGLLGHSILFIYYYQYT